MSYFKLKNHVYQKLKDRPETRDNDNILITSLILDQISKKNRTVSANELLMDIRTGEYGSIESITRCRRALQEQNPELRGCLYSKRRRYSKDVKEQLKFEF